MESIVVEGAWQRERGRGNMAEEAWLRERGGRNMAEGVWGK
jgi:hypothetical protein